MKQFIIGITASALLLSGSLFAQEDKEELKEDQRISIEKNEDGKVEVKVETRDSIPVSAKDTTIITSGNKTIYIVTEDVETDLDSLDMDDCYDSKAQLTNWAGIDLGINMFVSADGKFDLGEENEPFEVEYIQSRTISFNFWEQKSRIVGDYFGIVTGMGLQYNNYRLKNDYTLASGKDTIVAFMDSTIELRKNKFRTTWLNVPLLLEFNTSQDREKSFHLAAGVVGGLHLGSMFKQKYSQNGEDYKTSTKNDFQVAPYKLEAMLRIGYGRLNLFATYQITELFEEGHGPELYPFTAGVTVVAF